MDNAIKLLLCEDDPNLGNLLAQYLVAKGYSVDHRTDGKQGWEAYTKGKYDLLILDVMMPLKDGFTLAKDIRKRDEKTPIIFLTAKSMKQDTITGFQSGGDDYITKPFSMRELLARVHAVLRRVNGTAKASPTLRVGDVSLDRETRAVTVGGVDVKLTPSEFDLLAIMMTSPGRVYTRASLLEATQGTYFEGIARTIDVHIRNLRSKIEPNPAEPRYIETVFGIGYRFASK